MTLERASELVALLKDAKMDLFVHFYDVFNPTGTTPYDDLSSRLA